MPSELTGAPAVLVEASDPYKLAAMLKRERARHALIPQGPITMTRPGVYGCWVYQFRPIRPAWARPAGWVLAIAGLLAVEGLIGWWVLSALAGLSVALVVGVGALLLVGWGATRRGGGSGCTITVTHRHG